MGRAVGCRSSWPSTFGLTFEGLWSTSLVAFSGGFFYYIFAGFVFDFSYLLGSGCLFVTYGHGFAIYNLGFSVEWPLWTGEFFLFASLWLSEGCFVIRECSIVIFFTGFSLAGCFSGYNAVLFYVGVGNGGVEYISEVKGPRYGPLYLR